MLISDPIAHHAANLAAVVFPAIFLAQLLQVATVTGAVITCLVGLASLAWYTALFIDRRNRLKKEAEHEREKNSR